MTERVMTDGSSGVTGVTGGLLVAALEALPARLPDATELRHRLHADPRASGDERDTALLIEEALGADPADWIDQGFVARFGAADGPAVAIRAELDGLRVPEESTVPWRSTGPVAHLCGHDVHMAALTAAVATLRQVGLPVPLLAVLQPREETLPCGAADFVEAEALLRHDVRAFFGVHLQPRLAEGTFSAVPGPVNASADEFEVTMEGEPAHGAYPQLGRDPIVAIAALIGTLQQIVSRQNDPMNPSVLTVGAVSGGSSHNAIPGAATIRGTLRTFDEAFRTRMHQLVTQAAEGVALAHGCRARVDIATGEPVMDNDPELSAAVTAALRDRGFAEGPALRSCGADDFSFYSTVFPALMIFVGTGTAEAGTPGLHHPAFVPPDSAISDVARAMLVAYATASERVLA